MGRFEEGDILWAQSIKKSHTHTTCVIRHLFVTLILLVTILFCFFVGIPKFTLLQLVPRIFAMYEACTTVIAFMLPSPHHRKTQEVLFPSRRWWECYCHTLRNSTPLFIAQILPPYLAPVRLFVQLSINTLPICFTQIVMVLDWLPVPARCRPYLSSKAGDRSVEGPAARPW